MIECNAPAFPMMNELGEVHAPGLTKREYFAAMAMQGLISDASRFDSTAHNQDKHVPKRIAEMSVNVADALIAELSKEAK